ncbi:MAG TPA: hypothetical protein VGG86_02080 [Roseiarcus sp.]
MVAALLQLILIRSHLGQPVAQVGKRRGEARVEPTQGLSNGRAGGFLKVIEATARFIRSVGQAGRVLEAG